MTKVFELATESVALTICVQRRRRISSMYVVQYFSSSNSGTSLKVYNLSRDDFNQPPPPSPMGHPLLFFPGSVADCAVSGPNNGHPVQVCDGEMPSEKTLVSHLGFAMCISVLWILDHPNMV